MRQQIKKDFERHLAAKAAEYLDLSWDLGAYRESPDFLVTEGSHRFGLELAEIHFGPKSKKGSHLRQKEKYNSEWLESIREEIECHSRAPLTVKYYGDSTPENRAIILLHLREENFDEKPIFHRHLWRWENSFLDVSKALRPSWHFLRDTVGWVSTDPSCLQNEIYKKAAKLPVYQSACENTRLLVFSNRWNNSGKIIISDDFQPDIYGFEAVYFFSYPDTILQWHASDAAYKT